MPDIPITETNIIDFIDFIESARKPK